MLFKVHSHVLLNANHYIITGITNLVLSNCSQLTTWFYTKKEQLNWIPIIGTSKSQNQMTPESFFIKKFN